MSDKPRKRVPLDQKIDSLVDWCMNNPKTNLAKGNPDFINFFDTEYMEKHDEDFMKSLEDKKLPEAEKNEEINKYLAQRNDEYNKMRNLYFYLNQRKCNGKLTEEQVAKCKEGNVKGGFGYSQEIENIAHEYRINEKKVDCILAHYGSMDNYLMNNLSYESVGDSSGAIKECFEVEHRDHNGISDFIKDVCKKQETPIKALFAYNKDTVTEYFNTFPEAEKSLLVKYYGIDDSKGMTMAELGKELGVSKAAISDKFKKILANVNPADLPVTFIPDFKEISTEDRELIINALGNCVFVPDKKYESEPYNRENLHELEDICNKIKMYGTASLSKTEEELADVNEKIKDLTNPDALSIDALDLPVRLRNILKRDGIFTIDELIALEGIKLDIRLSSIKRHC